MGEIGDSVMGGGTILPHQHGQEHGDCRADHGPGRDEPRRIGEREEESALPPIELPACIGDDVACSENMETRFGRLGSIARRRRADQNRGIIEQPIGPGEFEKGVDKDHRESDDLHFPDGAACGDGERQIAENAQHIVRRAQQCERATDHKQRGGGKKGGAVLQARHDLCVDDPHLAVEHFVHPRHPVAMHQGVQAETAKTAAFQKLVIERPRGYEKDERRRIEPPDCHLCHALAQFL